MAGVLEGIRVLDFGRYIAGPYCAALLAEHGADVIRIEKREGSEDRFQAPVAETGEGALFLQMNRNKRGLTLDPMTPDGRQVVRRLVATADVVVANLPPQTLLAMQLDYESLTAVRPDIILTTVTAYGRGGPYSERVGFDGIGQVMSGAVYMTGTEEQPYRAQVPWVDFGTALHCAFGTMAALMARKATGKGQWVEGALLATAVTMTNAMLIEQAAIKPDRVPTGNRGQTSAPVDIFRGPAREASVAYVITNYMPGYAWLSNMVTVAILAGFSSVILVMLLGQSRVFYSMSRDGLLPAVFSDVHPRFRTPWKSNLLFLVFCGGFATFLPEDIVGDMTSIGTLFAFMIVCAGVWILRVKQPELQRDFRTPLVPLFPILGIIVCGAMIFGLGWTNWTRLGVWLVIGLAIYAFYGRKHSKLRAAASHAAPPPA